MRIVLFLFLIVCTPKSVIAQVLECDRYYIFDLRDSMINSDPVVYFKMYTDTNTTNLGSYTSLSFVDQNSDTLNPRPNYAFTTPVANTLSDTVEYILYLNEGLTSFPTDFDGILLMEVPFCEIAYRHPSATTFIGDLEKPSIQIFPNPSSDRVTISNISGVEITSIDLYNSTGKLILSETLNFDQLNMSHLESGIYYIKVYAGKKEFAIEKIVKN